MPISSPFNDKDFTFYEHPKNEAINLLQHSAMNLYVSPFFGFSEYSSE
jgi:hypothetical protein